MTHYLDEERQIGRATARRGHFGSCYLSAMSAPVPAAVKGLSLVSLFNDFASEMVYPLLPAFVTVTLGGGATRASARWMVPPTSPRRCSRWVSGRLADRPAWRRMLILAGYGTAILVRPLIAVAGAAWQVIGFRVIDRVGKGLRTAAARCDDRTR